MAKAPSYSSSTSGLRGQLLFDFSNCDRLQAGCDPNSPQTEQPAHKFKTQEYLLAAELAIQKQVENLRINGRTKETQDKYRTKLTQIANHTDIFDTTAVKTYIANLTRTDERNPKLNGLPISNGTKRNMIGVYAVFCRENNIQLRRAVYKYEPPTIHIPRTEDIDTIVNNASKEAFTCFKIMIETAVEPAELHNTNTTQIDTSKPNAVFDVIGTKEHDNNVYYLSTGTSDNLRAYLKFRREKHHKHNLIQPMQKDPSLYPFPTQDSLNDSWVKARRQAIKKKLCKTKLEEADLKESELEKIELKDLRNYAGALHYLTMGKDPLETKKFMRHKQLQQTENYLRGIKDFALTSKKIGKTVSTPEEAMELILTGFTEEAVFYQGTPNEKHILTKLTF
jgi:integrase